MNYFDPLHFGQDYMILPSEGSQQTARSSNNTSLGQTGPDEFALLGKKFGPNVDDTTNLYRWSDYCNEGVTSAQSGIQTTMTEHDHYAEPSMHLYPQLWPTFNNRVSPCAPDDYTTDPLSSLFSTPVVSQSEPVVTQDMIHPVAYFLPQLHHTADAVNAEQDTRQSHNTRTPISETEEDITTIGSVLSNGKLLCAAKGCEGLTFGRQAELRRHHTTLHAAIKPNFWCQVSTCRRSENAGGRAFHRKDKLAAHVKSMHSDAQDLYT